MNGRKEAGRNSRAPKRRCNEIFSVTLLSPHRDGCLKPLRCGTSIGIFSILRCHAAVFFFVSFSFLFVWMNSVVEGSIAKEGCFCVRILGIEVFPFFEILRSSTHEPALLFIRCGKLLHE